MRWCCPRCKTEHKKIHFGAKGQIICPHCGYGAIGYVPINQAIYGESYTSNIWVI